MCLPVALFLTQYFKWKLRDPVDLRIESAIVMQGDYPVPGMQVIRQELLAAWAKLYARGRRAQQGDPITLCAEILVRMAPDHAADLGMPIQYAEHGLAIAQAQLIYPGTGQLHRRVMHRHQARLLSVGAEFRIQTRQFSFPPTGRDGPRQARRCST